MSLKRTNTLVILILTKYTTHLFSKLIHNFLIFMIMYISLAIPNICFAKAGTFANTKLKIIPITVKSFEEIAKYQENYIPANVINLKDSIISAEISGIIEKIELFVGDHVKKNGKIANIECLDYKSKLKQIQANIKAIKAEIDLTKWQLDKALTLKQKDHVSQEYIKKHSSNLARLNANLGSETESLKTAELNVERCNITAPYKGVITQRYVSEGEYVSTGQKIVKLVNTENLELEARAHYNEIISLKKTNKIFFELNNVSYPVSLRTIVPNQDPKNRTQTIRFTFTKNKPTPGSAGNLVWQSKNRAIPPEYIRQIGKKYGIFIVKNKKAKFYPLPNAIEGQSVFVNTPITYPIIIDGRYNVKDGQEVKVQNILKGLK